MATPRPDPTTPAGVAAATFNTVRKGADPDAVRTFLHQVADRMAQLQDEVLDLRQQLASASSAPAPEPTEAQIAQYLGEETARIVQAAREAAMEIRQKAEDAAGQLLRDANDEAQRTRSETEQELARLRAQANSDALAEVDAARNEGRSMVAEAREYREKVLADVNRRRELARQQLSDVEAGRLRLVQAFDAARRATQSVLEELGSYAPDETDEFVNLSPTTEPVPLIVPGSRPPEPRSAARTAPEPTDDELALAGAGPEATTDIEADAASLTEPGATADAEPSVEPAAEVAETTGSEPTVVETESPTEAEAAPEPEPTLEPAPAEPAAAEPEAPAESEAEASEEATPADATAPSATEPEPEPEPVKAVVGMYAGELESPLAAEVASSERASVDDLFAKLRKASAEMVAREPAAAATATEEPPAAADADRGAFGVRDEVLVPLIVASARKLKRVLADEQNEVLDHLRRNQPGDMLPSAADHAGRYAAAIEAELREAMTAGATSVGGTAKRDANAAKHVKAALAEGIVDPLRDRLQRAMQQAGADGNELASLVRAVYREWKSSRIDDQIDDVLRLAFDEGAYAALTPGTPVSWVLDPHSGACGPDCEDNSLGGAVAAGDAFPTGHLHPPLHGGCRCLLQVAQL
jgi:cell division septum initiation protein DivIVA